MVILVTGGYYRSFSSYLEAERCHKQPIPEMGLISLVNERGDNEADCLLNKNFGELGDSWACSPRSRSVSAPPDTSTQGGQQGTGRPGISGK